MVAYTQTHPSAKRTLYPGHTLRGADPHTCSPTYPPPSPTACYLFFPGGIPFYPPSIGVCISIILFFYGVHGSRLVSLSPVVLTTVIQSHPA